MYTKSHRKTGYKFFLHLHMCSGMESVWLVGYYKRGLGIYNGHEWMYRMMNDKLDTY